MSLPQIFYRHEGKWIRLGELYKRLHKCSGKAKILASVTVKNKQDQPVKIVFVRHRHKRNWLAILSLIVAMQRLLILAIDKVRASGKVAESVIMTLLETIMGSVIDLMQSSQVTGELNFGLSGS